MTEGDLTLFHDSFARATRDRRFLDRFYERFMKSSPEVAAKFRNTDFKRQKALLQRSLLMILNAAVRRSTDFSDLRALAIRHSRQGLDIPPHMYDLWLQSLVETVAECDPHWDSETGDVWRNAFRPAIDFIVSLY